MNATSRLQFRRTIDSGFAIAFPDIITETDQCFASPLWPPPSLPLRPAPPWHSTAPPQPTAKPGILKETPAQMAAVGKQLAGGDTFNAIASATADLRIRYPGVESAEVVNYLVTAYCPAVAADNKLSEAQKKSAVDGFAAQVMRQVY